MKKLWIENIDLPAIVYEELAPNETFTDKTDDIEAWDIALNVLDWSRRRDIITPLFYMESGAQLQNFSLMSVEKKIIGCKYFLIPFSIRLQIVSEEQDKLNFDFLLFETKKSRIDCVNAMRILCGNYIRKGTLTLAKTQELFNDISPYIDLFIEANISNFKKFIFGIDEFVGIFASKSYYSVELQNDLMNIYNGEY